MRLANTMPSKLDGNLCDIYSDYMVRHFPSLGPDPTSDFQVLATIRYDPNLSEITPLSYEDITRQNFFLLEEHVARLNFTFEFFHNLYGTAMDFEVTQEILWKQLVESLRSSGKIVFMPYKIRGLFKLDGSAVLEIHDTTNRLNLLGPLYPKAGVNFGVNVDIGGLEYLHNFGTSDGAEDIVWDVYLNKNSTLMSPFTSFKTTKRDVYNTARAILPGLNPGIEEVLLFNTQDQLMEGSISNVAIQRKSDKRWITPLLSSGCLCGVTRHFLLRRNLIEEELITMNQLEVGMDVLLFNGVMGVVKGKIVG
ncbi:uncharacterized protein LODBEIA_P44150 [Lodderomyces beijingensis]|uniref:Aminodeoxychorismate lyase n=1 Tax=Lodderomyces beijingensis TaxID=1775926 RepID=A0ABP0ZSW0_9ASCO